MRKRHAMTPETRAGFCFLRCLFRSLTRSLLQPLNEAFPIPDQRHQGVVSSSGAKATIAPLPLFRDTGGAREQRKV